MKNGKNWLIGILFFVGLIILISIFIIVPVFLISEPEEQAPVFPTPEPTPSPGPSPAPSPAPSPGPSPSPSGDTGTFLVNRLGKTVVQTLISNGGTILDNLRRIVGQTFTSSSSTQILKYIEITIQKNPFTKLEQTPLDMTIYQTNSDHTPENVPLVLQSKNIPKGFEGVIRFENLDISLKPNTEYVVVFSCPTPPPREENAIRWYVSDQTTPLQPPLYQIVSSNGSAWQVSKDQFLTMAVNVQ